jgi:hypothetical protein
VRQRALPRAALLGRGEAEADAIRVHFEMRCRCAHLISQQRRGIGWPRISQRQRLASHLAEATPPAVAGCCARRALRDRLFFVVSFLSLLSDYSSFPMLPPPPPATVCLPPYTRKRILTRHWQAGFLTLPLDDYDDDTGACSRAA